MSHIFSFLYFPCLQKMPEFRFSSIIKNFTLILTPICFIELICLLPNLASSLCCKSFCFNCTAAIWSSYSFKFKLSIVRCQYCWRKRHIFFNIKTQISISICQYISISICQYNTNIEHIKHFDISANNLTFFLHTQVLFKWECLVLANFPSFLLETTYQISELKLNWGKTTLL